MKKFFALMLVVAMLSVAGSAMAVTISADSASLTSTGRAEVSTNVWVLPENEGILSVDVYSGTAKGWTYVALSGDKTSGDETYTVYTVTFAPTAAVVSGSYTATIRARETYTPAAGHSMVTETASTDIAVTVTVTTPVEPVQSKDVETLVISTDLATEQTASDAVRDVPTATRNQITTLGGNGLRSLFQAMGIGNKTKSATSMVNTVTAATGRNYNSGTSSTAKAQNIANGSARFTNLTGGSNYRGVSTTSPFTSSTEGYLSMKQTVNAKFANYQPVMNTFKYRHVGPATADFAAAVDVSSYNEAIFFDNSGNSIDKIPSTGEFTAVVYVETGYVYEPVLAVYVSDESADAFNTLTGSESKDVTIVVASDDVQPTPVDPWGGKTYLIDVPQASIDLIASVDNRTLVTLAAATVTAEPASDTAVYSVGGVSKDVVASLPTITNIAPNAAGQAYILAFKYSRPSVVGRTISGDPEFYPQGPTGDQKGRVYNNTGLATLSDIVTGNIGYVVFAVASNDTFASFYAANADFASPRVLATSVPVVSPTPTPTYDRGTSSSSGGCSAGSAALALAVLGSFILTRKK